MYNIQIFPVVMPPDPVATPSRAYHSIEGQAPQARTQIIFSSPNVELNLHN